MSGWRGAARPSILTLAAILGMAAATALPATAQQSRSQFDFYMLSLSWSPSFCEEAGERGRAPQQQCGARPFSFVVHGFWPQNERGFPEYCQVPSPRLPREIVTTMLDLMPAPQLVFHEWDRHGTCSGLGPHGYFDAVRRARAAVRIPERFHELRAPLMVSPGEVEDAFLKANPDLPRDGIVVSCDQRRLREIRICMTKTLGFRDCGQAARRSCRRERIVMPPVRTRL